MILTYPKNNGFYVDYGTQRVRYNYYAYARDSTEYLAQQKWCRENFKPYVWWYRHSQKEFAFVREKDAVWFALMWS